MSETCPKNKKRFLFWKWDGPHIEKIIGLRRLGDTHFGWCEAEFHCGKCGVVLGIKPRRDVQLQKLGFDAEKLKELNTWSLFQRPSEYMSTVAERASDGEKK